MTQVDLPELTRRAIHTATTIAGLALRIGIAITEPATDRLRRAIRDTRR